METRTAAGFVIARQTPQGWHYLLLRNARHGTWAFPKGHAEAGESPMATARRELLEETGIAQIDVVPGFQHSVEYEVISRKRGNYHKRVTYLLATVQSDAIERSDEHDQAGWYALPEALDLLQHEQSRHVLRAAARALEDR